MSKYYVVWRGRIPGVYESYDDVLDQVVNYPGAAFRGYSTSEEATVAYRRGVAESDRMDIGKLLMQSIETSMAKRPAGNKPDYMMFNEIDLNGWAVDASCLGNPGVMEYRGVELMSGKEIFRVGPFEDATNNIGEFLAIVHALALMYQKGERHTIYSDSVSGMAWVRNKCVKTKLQPTARNQKVFELMARAQTWLRTHSSDVPILKWQTEIWGEIPADFGRK